MKTNHWAVTVLSAALSISISSVAFSAKEPVWDANKVELTSEKLADGVYAYYSTKAKTKEAKGLPVATSGGFIVGDKGVLMIETMLNERLYKQATALITKATDKPLNFAVNTSFHGDHSYGNMYLPKETRIIQHATAKNYIDTHFEGDTQFMMQNFGRGRGIEAIKPTAADLLVAKDGKLTVDLGGKKVDIMDFGFAQTGGDLFVWEPKSKVLWTGNSIVAVKPALPWLLDGHLVETLESFKKVYDFLPADARLVPGHGSVMVREDLKWHIDYLTAVKTQVQAAIDEGLSLKETVAKVKMENFGGYALFGWVHPGLNVPAAYRDLSK